MRTGVRLWRIKHEYRFSTLLGDCVIVIDDYRSVRIPIRRYPDTEDQEVDGKRKRDRSREGKDRGEKYPSQPDSERRRRHAIHWQNYRMVPDAGSSRHGDLLTMSAVARRAFLCPQTL
jgi:hypothetical protein